MNEDQLKERLKLAQEALSASDAIISHLLGAYPYKEFIPEWHKSYRAYIDHVIEFGEE